MVNNNISTQNLQNNDLGGRAFKALQKEFVVVGKTRVNSWHAWLILGVVTGMVAGILFVANRSGEIDSAAAAEGTIILLSPNGGERWEKKGTYRIEWFSTEVGEVRIQLMRDGKTVRNVTKRTDAGVGFYDWSVPRGQRVGEGYSILVSGKNKIDLVSDESDATFSIVEEGTGDKGGGSEPPPLESVVKMPVILPNGGIFTDSVNVEIQVATPDVEIYYTTDGSDPTIASNLYAFPFELTTTATVKARAFRDEYAPSDIVSALFIKETAPSDGQTMIIPVTIDSTLKTAHKNNNTGIIEHLLVKRSGSVNRAIVGFDLSGFPEPSSIKKATLVLTRMNLGNFGKEGRLVGAYRTFDDWTEGNSRFDKFKDQPPVVGTGTGVTWHCPIDLDISNGKMDCDNPWYGGRFNEEPTDAVLHIKGMTETPAWDLTADVVSALEEGLPSVSWIFKKTEEYLSGGVFYYSREGAVYFSDPDLAPRMILEIQ